MKNKLRLTVTLSFFIFAPQAFCLPLAGLNTNGTVNQIETTTGALTLVTDQPLTSFTLGGLTRNENKLVYIAAPSGTSENALFSVNLKTAAVTTVDLDRDDEPRVMFFNGTKLFAIFYNGTLGTAGLYRIAPGTGVTTLIQDMSALDVEPIGGAIAQLDGFFYTIVRPDTDYAARKLMRFKTNSRAPQVLDILAPDSTPVRCERLKTNAAKQKFVCLASNLAETGVSICKLSKQGRAICGAPLADVERVAGGHSMATPDYKTFYSLVYQPGDPSSQRLIKFNARGVVKSTVIVDTINVGVEFKPAAPPV